MKIRIHPALYVYLITMVLLSSVETCLGAAVALLVHEMGHFVLGQMTGEKMDQLILTPFGGIFTYAEGRSPSKGIKGIVTALGGPAANYLVLMFADRMTPLLDRTLLDGIVSSNAVMLCLNLMPVLPLDGGRIVFCFGYYIFPVFRLITVLSWMGIMMGVGLIVLAVYGIFIVQRLNCSLLIVGGYLMYCAWSSKSQMMIENMFSVIEERKEIKSVLPMKVYCVPPLTKLIHLIPYLGESYICEFVFEDERGEHRIPESMICRSLCDRPLAAIQDIFLQ